MRDHVIRDVASQLSLRAVRTERHGNPTERGHATFPTHFVTKYVTSLHRYAPPRHAVPSMVLRTAESGTRLGLELWEHSCAFEFRVTGRGFRGDTMVLKLTCVEGQRQAPLGIARISAAG